MALPTIFSELPQAHGSPRRGRRRIIPISYDALAQILRGEVKIVEGMPVDADIISVNRISIFATCEIVVESESFEPLKPGEVIPRVIPLLQQTK